MSEEDSPEVFSAKRWHAKCREAGLGGPFEPGTERVANAMATDFTRALAEAAACVSYHADNKNIVTTTHLHRAADFLAPFDDFLALRNQQISRNNRKKK